MSGSDASIVAAVVSNATDAPWAAIACAEANASFAGGGTTFHENVPVNARPLSSFRRYVVPAVTWNSPCSSHVRIVVSDVRLLPVYANNGASQHGSLSITARPDVDGVQVNQIER